MPPRVRTRTSKAMKENVDTENKTKPLKNNTKTFRKALADKTNSASDETSVESPKKSKRVNKITAAQPKQKSGVISEELPRRNRRVPQRFQKDVVTNIFKTVSPIITTFDSPKATKNNLSTSSTKDTPVKITESEVSPFKTPSKLETSLVANRPRRICRLPSRFDDHFVSPNKVIPLQPNNASTPKQPSTIIVNKIERNGMKDAHISKPTLSVKTLKKITKDVPSTAIINPDTNNNANNTRSTRSNKVPPKPSAPKKSSPKVNTSQNLVDNSPSKVLVTKNKIHRPQNAKKVPDKNLSFQVLGGKKKLQETVNKDLDVFEFTFDPTEEPQPQKKLRKKPAIKKPKAPKPKTVTSYKSTYDKNISKALSALKKTIQTSKNVGANKLAQIQEINDEIPKPNGQNHIASMNDTGKTSVHEGNYPSIRIEDIAADIEPSLDHHTDLNYSPVNSPRPQSPIVNQTSVNSPRRQSPSVNPTGSQKQNPERVRNIDPLNLQEDLSFFDDIPVASSSMNMSVRHPLASPWRVEFGSLPIKWHSNAYVKPNMTPAVESSFICTEDSNRKKHVYTNMVPETNESLPQVFADAPSLKQTSIISFIKEVAERQAKKKRGRSVSPSKAVEFNKIDVEGNLSTTSVEKVSNNQAPDEVSSNIDSSNDTENSKENRKTRKHKNNENICEIPTKSPRTEKNKDCTYFGFNDSEDQENVSPSKTKINARGRSLRPRTRPVLKEINGPTRAALPIAVKSKIATSSESVNKVYGELKSAADAPVFLENVENNMTNIEDLSADDSQSVHLFEDIDVVHHLKPTRKSYGKAKKVTFRQLDGDSEEGITQQNDQSSFEDDLGDLTFDIPDVKEKKKTKKKRPKKLMSKKEEKEAEEWAAGFNSMCEEIEEFPLVVE